VPPQRRLRRSGKSARLPDERIPAENQKMKPGEIRPIAVCVFRHQNRVFVAEGDDSVKRETFYRPLGGTIEFGERGRDCIVRELREEMGAEVKDIAHVDTIENIFTYDGQPGHEIVLVSEANLADWRLYQVEWVRCRDNGEDFAARWKPLSEFRDGKAHLYPEGLLDLLDEKTKR